MEHHPSLLNVSSLIEVCHLYWTQHGFIASYSLSIQANKKVSLRWTTHELGGLSWKDIQMAEFSDKQGLRFQEKDERIKE